MIVVREVAGVVPTPRPGGRRVARRAEQRPSHVGVDPVRLPSALVKEVDDLRPPRGRSSP